MSHAEESLEDIPYDSDEAVTGGPPKLSQRRSSVKNLIKIFQPISQEEKLARLAGTTVETNAPTKAPVQAPRNINGSVRYELGLHLASLAAISLFHSTFRYLTLSLHILQSQSSCNQLCA